MRKVLGLLLVAAMVAGCTSTYMPKHTRQLRLIMVDGAPCVVREGRKYQIGLGGGLVEAVADQPEALEHAEAFRDGRVWGLVLSVGGAAVMVGGAPVLAVASQDEDGANVPLVAGVVLAGLAAYSLGLGMIVASEPRMFDAINAFNDAVEAGPPPGPAGGPLPADRGPLPPLPAPVTPTHP